MGHTVWSQRITIDILIGELKDYARSLRPEDRMIFENLMKAPLKHIGSITFASSMHAWAFLIISIILEQEKNVARGRLQELQQDSALGEESRK